MKHMPPEYYRMLEEARRKIDTGVPLFDPHPNARLHETAEEQRLRLETDLSKLEQGEQWVREEKQNG